LYRNNALLIAGILILVFVILLTVLKLTTEPGVAPPEEPTSQQEAATSELQELPVRHYKPSHPAGIERYRSVVSDSAYMVPEPAESEEERVIPYDPLVFVSDEFVPYSAYIKKGKQYKLPISVEWQKVVWNYAQEYEVPYNVVLAIAGVETSFDVFRGAVKSRTTSVVYYGCGMVSTVSKDKISAAIGMDMCTPEGGVAAMCYVFGKKYKEFDGNVVYALMAYNMGSGGARRAISQGRTSSGYAEKVLDISQGFLWEEEE